MIRHAALPVPDPDPKAMVVRTQLGTIEAGEWKGSGFGITIAGAAIYLDAKRNDEDLGIVVISATMWLGAIIGALEGEQDAFPAYTLQQAADELGVSASTLRNQVNAGRLAATKVGNVWTIASDELARYRRESLGQKKGGKS